MSRYSYSLPTDRQHVHGMGGGAKDPGHGLISTMEQTHPTFQAQVLTLTLTNCLAGDFGPAASRISKHIGRFAPDAWTFEPEVTANSHQRTNVYRTDEGFWDTRYLSACFFHCCRDKKTLSPLAHESRDCSQRQPPRTITLTRRGQRPPCSGQQVAQSFIVPTLARLVVCGAWDVWVV
jgi:hypothetical protein